MSEPALYVGASRLALRVAEDIEDLSLVLSDRGDFIVTGGAESFVALVEEPKPWAAFPAKGNSVWSGAAIGPCEIELDTTSMQSELKGGPGLGCIVHRGDGLYLVARTNPQGFFDETRLPLSVPIDGTRQEFGFWFSRWRLVLRDGELREVIREFDVSPGSSKREASKASSSS